MRPTTELLTQPDFRAALMESFKKGGIPPAGVLGLVDGGGFWDAYSVREMGMRIGMEVMELQLE